MNEYPPDPITGRCFYCNQSGKNYYWFTIEMVGHYHFTKVRCDRWICIVARFLLRRR